MEEEVGWEFLKLLPFLVPCCDMPLSVDCRMNQVFNQLFTTNEMLPYASSLGNHFKMYTESADYGTLGTIPEIQLTTDSFRCQFNTCCLRKANVLVAVSHLRDKLPQGGSEGESESATPPSPSPLCG